MNDEIWSDIVYSDAQFHSILNLGNERNKRTLSVFGFSKSFGIDAQVVGFVEEATKNELIIESEKGRFTY